MAEGVAWAIYSDESSYNYGIVRGVGAVGLRLDDAPRLDTELADLLRASGVRELKWEKVRTARMAFAAEKALAWALDHALGGDLEIETLTWEVASAAASRARRPALANLRDSYTTLLASMMARQTQRDDPARPWRIVPDEQTALLGAHAGSLTTGRRHHTLALRDAAIDSARRPLHRASDLLARGLRRL